MTQPALAETFEPQLDATRVYESYGRFLWRTLFRLGVPANDLPDALQDVLVVVHRRGSEFEPGAKPTSWLYTICRRVAAARRRKAHMCHEILGDHIQPIEPEDPERLMTKRRNQARLERILDQLSDDHRIVFVMFEIEGLSCPEIAQELGQPLGTVYSRLHAARQSFHKALARAKASEQHRSKTLLGRGEI